MKSPFVLDVTSATFGKEVIEASKQLPVVVDFWAPWCGPCRALGPILEKLAGEYAGQFRLAKVNSDENLELAREFNVRSIPDVRAFRDGQQVDQFMGTLPESHVRAFIEGVVPSPAEVERLRAAGSESDLAARVAANPADLEARLALAGALAARRSWREAMDQLLEIVRRDKSWRDGEARRQMLAIFNLAAGEPDLVSEYRRKLGSALN